MIKRMRFIHFRGLDDFTLEFGPGQNQLKGKNEARKTTVKEGIAFAYYGCDSSGGKNPDHLISLDKEAAELILETDRATIHRIKKRGLTSSVKLQLAGTPGVQMNQTEFTDLLGISFDVFSSCYNAGYFMLLSEAKKMEVIGQVAKIDRKKLLESLIPGVAIPAKVKLENLRGDAQVVAAERRGAQNQYTADSATLVQIENQIKEHRELSGMNPALLKKEIETLTARSDLFHVYQQELSAYNLARARAKEIEETNNKAKAEEKKITLEIKALGSEPSLNVEELQEQGTQIVKELAVVKSQHQILPPEPRLCEIHANEKTCTRCGQLIPPKLKESMEQERTNALNQYNKESRKIADHNQDVILRVDTLGKRYEANRQALLDGQKALADWSLKSADLNRRLSELVIKDARIPPAPIRPDGDEKEIRDRLSDFKAKGYAVQMLEQRHSGLTEKEKNLREALDKRTKYVEDLKKIEEALLKMPEVEVKQTLEMLKMENTLMGFKDGEVVVTNHKLVPYPCLSSGKKLKVDLEIASTFQRLVSRPPNFYFLDNADLMDQYISHLPKNSQTFVAVVDPSVDIVTVIAL